MGETYKNAGVNIQAGEETVNSIKDYAKSTFNKNVLTGLGLFGGFYEFDVKKYNEPVLVSSVDGVGTKLKVAIAMNKHDTIGQDIVNHCVDDIAVCGAEPIYFLDYVAFGKLEPERASDIIKGMSIACKENECALIGGETAEMPGMYAEDDYDISGTIVGVVEKSEIINGSKVEKDDVLIGFGSTGLHTNGYSLARKVLETKYAYNDTPDELENSVGDELLKVHKSYLPLIKTLKKTGAIHGFSHITGGGIVGNTKRILPEGRSLNIDWKAWEPLPIFQLIQTVGGIADDEMREVFNLGIGLIAVVHKKDVDTIIEAATTIGEKGVVMGAVE